MWSVPIRSRIANAVVSKEFGDCVAPLICVKYKRVIGEGGYDPLAQAVYSAREFFVSEVCGFCVFLHLYSHTHSSSPSFLLAGAGPYLCVLGLVFTDKSIVQRLTDIMWAREATTWEDAWVYRLSRIFESLRLAVAALDEYYNQVSKDPNIPALVDNEPHPRFSPHPTRFRALKPLWSLSGSNSSILMPAARSLLT